MVQDAGKTTQAGSCFKRLQRLRATVFHLGNGFSVTGIPVDKRAGLLSLFKSPDMSGNLFHSSLTERQRANVRGNGDVFLFPERVVFGKWFFTCYVERSRPDLSGF